MPQLLVKSVVFSLITLIQSLAFAQATAPAPRTEIPEAPKESPKESPKVTPSNQEREDDLVVLKDGSRYRGKIIEAVAGDHISIEVAPETVRQVSIEEVTYAGPVNLGPPMTAIARNPTTPVSPSPVAVGRTTPASPSPVTVATTERGAKPGEAIVSFQSKTPGLIVWVASESPEATQDQSTGFKRLCETPCSYPLLFGDYRIAYSIGADKPLESRSQIHIKSETRFETEVVSNRPLRIVGWVVLGLGAATGTVLISTAAGLPPGDSRRSKYVTGGVVGLAGGLLVGLALGLTSDTAVVLEVTPPAQGKSPSAPAQGSYNGLSWVGRF